MRWPDLALALAATLITLACLEALARVVVGPRPAAPAARAELRQVAGGALYCPPPELSRPYFASRPRYPGCVFYPRNNIATRNLFDVHPGVRPPLRIVGLGDSMVYGYGVDHEDTFLYRLQQALRARLGAPRLEVVNAARPGFDLEDSHSVLVDKVLRLPVDIVILGLHLNDFLRFPTRTLRTSYDLPLREHSRLLDGLLSRLELKRSGEINERELLDSYDEQARSRLFARLRAIHRDLKARNIPLLVLVFPLFVDLDDYPFGHIHREIGEFLSAEGIDHIDFLASFAGATDEDYWITALDQHPNEKANAVFFERVLAHVTSRGGLPTRD